MNRTGSEQPLILVITLSNIGDAVMTTPVLQTLHRLYPNALIDMVVDRRSRELFTQCPYIGELFEKDKHSFLRGVPGLVFRLRKKNYQLIVDLRTDVLAYFLRAEKKLTKRNSDPKAQHAVEQHMSVLDSLSVKTGATGCCLWIGDDDIKHAQEVLGSNAGKKILCIAPGANSPGKIWSAHNYRELLDSIAKQFDCVLLLGSREDAETAKPLCTDPGYLIINLCGKTTLLQAAAFLKHVTLFIGNDSGVGHMAAAMGVPTCTLFGPGHPERYHPWGERSTWLANAMANINNIQPVEVIRHIRSAEMIV